MSALTERYPVIRGAWLAGHLVYHRAEDEMARWLVDGERVYEWSDAVNEWEVRTCCGLLLDRWTRETNGTVQYTHLSARNAQLIASPCRKCWPAREEEAADA